MIDTEHLTYEVVGTTAIVTMNRPEAKNALSRLRSGLVFNVEVLLRHGGDINACVTLDC